MHLRHEHVLETAFPLYSSVKRGAIGITQLLQCHVHKWATSLHTLCIYKLTLWDLYEKVLEL